MNLRGTIRNGRVEPDRTIDFPDGTRVTIKSLRSVRYPNRSNRSLVKDPVFRIGDLAIPMGVRNLAAQHDNYLYGTPNRSAAKSKKPAKTGRNSKR